MLCYSCQSIMPLYILSSVMVDNLSNAQHAAKALTPSGMAEKDVVACWFFWFLIFCLAYIVY